MAITKPINLRNPGKFFVGKWVRVKNSNNTNIRIVTIRFFSTQIRKFFKFIYILSSVATVLKSCLL